MKALTDAWIVTAGCYSDYGVIAAFSTQALADAYAAESNERYKFSGCDVYQVERVDLDPVLPSLVEKKLSDVG